MDTTNFADILKAALPLQEQQPSLFDSTTLKQGENLWAHLNDLAETDPEGYQAFIKKVLSESKPSASSSSRKIKILPGLIVPCQTISTNRPCFVNLAHSNAIPAAPPIDPLNIPICLSAIRPLDPQDSPVNGKEGDVVDAVVNPETFGKCKQDKQYLEELIQVIVDSIRQELGVSLKRKAIVYDVYQGPYGWDDNGQPRTSYEYSSSSNINKTDAKEMPSRSGGGIPPPKKTGTDILFKQPVDSELEDDTVLPKLIISEAPAGSTGKKPGISFVKPIIQEESSLVTPQVQEKSAPEENQVVWNIHLPGITSQADVILKVSQDNKQLVLTAGVYKVERDFPTLLLSNTGTRPSFTAKFIRPKELLRVKFLFT